MSEGELYAYYKRIGMLQVYFRISPGGVDSDGPGVSVFSALDALLVASGSQ
jgi:hypothetical protein